MKREKTDYPGVTFYVREDGEKVYYARYRTGGRGTKEVEEPVGTSSKGMTPAKASHIRAAKMTGKAESNKEKRASLIKDKDAWTLKKLFDQYQTTLAQNFSRVTDRHYFKRLEKIQDTEPKQLVSTDIESIKRIMEKEGKSAQTIKHVLNLITRTVNYGIKAGLIDKHDSYNFVITKPHVDTHKTENMDSETFARYLAALDEEKNQECASILRLALFTGMRKSAILSLSWEHIDFKNGTIELAGKSAKNNKTSFIPLNRIAREVLEKLNPKKAGLIFPSPKTTEQREDFRKMPRRIREKAGLPPDFRPMHGLRHTYASRLASSGKVDLYTLQKLLTHESPDMTQRYAHLSDEAMKRAAAVADEIFSGKTGGNG